MVAGGRACTRTRWGFDFSFRFFLFFRFSFRVCKITNPTFPVSPPSPYSPSFLGLQRAPDGFRTETSVSVRVVALTAGTGLPSESDSPVWYHTKPRPVRVPCNLDLDYARYSLGKFPSLLCPETLPRLPSRRPIQTRELALQQELRLSMYTALCEKDAENFGEEFESTTMGKSRHVKIKPRKSNKKQRRPCRSILLDSASWSEEIPHLSSPPGTILHPELAQTQCRLWFGVSLYTHREKSDEAEFVYSTN